MHILIDMQGAQSGSSKHRGVGRYTAEMVKSLLKVNAGTHKITLLFNYELDTSVDSNHELLSSLSPFFNNVEIRYWFAELGDISGISGNPVARTCAEILREWNIQQLEPDLVWSTNLQEGWFDNSVTSVHRLDSNIIYCSTLHDVIPLIYPDIYLSSSICNWYKEKIIHAEKSDIVLTVSEYSRNTISKLTKIKKQKIHVAYNSYNSSIFYPSGNDNKETLITDKVNDCSFILYVGGADAHKNLDRLIEAYSKLSNELQRQFNLVFASSAVKHQESHLRSLARNFGIESDKLVFLGDTTDQKLASLMRGCSAFIFPSYNEGFGLPPLEAMACGAIAIGANAASIPEVINDKRALFDPFDTNDMAQKLTQCLTDTQFRKSIEKNITNHISNFSWDGSARLILNIFESSLDKLKAKKKTRTYNYSDICDYISTSVDINKIDLVRLARSIFNNEIPKISKKRLYLDLSCLVHFDHATGIQRVVRAVMDELYKNPLPEYEISLVFSYAGHSQFYSASFDKQKFTIPNDDELENNIIDFTPGDILLFLDLHPGSAISKTETIDKLKKRGVYVYFVVYDLLPISHPEYFVRELSIEFSEWLKTITHSNGAMCISNDVAQKFNQWTIDHCIHLPYDFKIRYFHLGADLHNSQPSKGIPNYADELLKKFKENNMFLMVGTVEPRKGHKLIIDAFDELWREGFQGMLVIVGREGWKNESTIKRIKEHPELNSRLFWLHGISDEFLEMIYEYSAALIAASEGEGFGLPLIEAAQHKKPIIARDIAVFREVAQEYAYYFNGTDGYDVAEQIKNWIDLYNKNQHPKSDAMPLLSWKQSVSQLLKAMDVLI